MTTKTENLADLSDAQLVQRCNERDEQAFEQIVRRYQSLVCSVAFSRCGDLALSEDLAQEAFVLAWQKLSQLQDPARFKNWICTIVRNLANRQSQRDARRPATDTDAVAESVMDGETADQQAISAEEQALVWQALAEVPETYREPMILFYREEQSVANVAEALDLSVDAVKQRLSRGRKMLQLQLAATVESALAPTKPGRKFTGAVLAALAASSGKTAAAAGTLQSGTAAASAAGGLHSLWLGPLLQLPVLGWLYKVSYDDMRSDEERRMWRRFNGGALCGLLVLIPAIFSTIWWQQLVEPWWLRGFIIPGLMMVFMIPLVICGRRFGKKIEAMRREDGDEMSRKPPACESQAHESPRQVGSLPYFCLSGLLVAAGPAILAFAAGDWPVAFAMAACATVVAILSTRVCVRRPHWKYKPFTFGLAIIALVMIGIMLWRRSHWQPAFANYLLWFTGALQLMAMAFAILSTLAWKKYGRRS